MRPGHDVVFAFGAPPARARSGHGAPPQIVCLGWIGDSEGEAAIAAGRADDLIILPLRQQDMADMIGALHRNSLRGKAILERAPHGTPDRRRASPAAMCWWPTTMP